MKIQLAYRPVPALRGSRHIVTRILDQLGHDVVQIEDGRFDDDPQSVLWIMENANWFPRIIRQLLRTRRSERPRLAVWHWEPLPLPPAANAGRPRLSLRELAKIALNDCRATDPYTNLRRLRWLAANGLPDLLVVPSMGWHESLTAKGIRSTWVPLGYETGYGTCLDQKRDLRVVFLGSLDVPRRKRILRCLRRQGVDVLAKGSWFDPRCWGTTRTQLINRAVIFLNIQRFSGEVSAHRLILGMANKSLVVSEPIYAPHPFEPGHHYVEATVEEMPRVLRHYLNETGERTQIVDRAFDLVHRELTMERSVAQIVSLLDGQPVLGALPREAQKPFEYDRHDRLVINSAPSSGA